MTGLKLATYDQKTEKRSVVNVGNVRVGIDFVLIAGPCSVESEIQTI